MRKLFGTDGIRGRANQFPMTADAALRIGGAAGRYFSQGSSAGKRVVIGKDTRLSGYMFENALTAGLTSTGMNVLLLGPMPTPGVGMMTRSMRADLGIMISASHNPHYDNGIKFFGPDGYKLSDAAETEIEAMIDGMIESALPAEIGRAKRVDDGLHRYIERVKGTLPLGTMFSGLKVVIDCANGAAYRTAPEALWELGAEVIPVGVSPNGRNINVECGSTAPQVAAETVVAHGADVGICLDGDADRIIVIDENGTVADGDQIMALLAREWMQEQTLAQGVLVATIMSNLGLERFMEAKGGQLVRTQVGDRYVVEEMRKNRFNLGGEQSGHIVMTDFATTGDGLLAGLQFLKCMQLSGKKASELMRNFEKIPQVLQNVRYGDGIDPLGRETVQEVIAKAEKRLADKGRLVIRKSGTEPLIRVMAECEDADLMQDVVAQVVDAVDQIATP